MVCEGKTTVAADEEHAKEEACEEVGQSAGLLESAAARDLGTDLHGDAAATAAAAEAAAARRDQATPAATRDKHEDKVKDLAGDTASSRSGSKCDEAAFDNSAVHKKDADDGNNKEILTLMNERRSIGGEGEERLREVNKKIKKCIRDKKRPRGQQKIMQTFEELKGIKKTRTSNP